MTRREIGNMLDVENKMNHNENYSDLYNLIQNVSDKAQSAYELWLQEGNSGTVEDFFYSQKGPSAYESAVANGFAGTEQQWLITLKEDFKPKEAVATKTALPTNSEKLEIRLVQDENKQYIYDGAKWVEYGAINADGLEPLKDEIAETERVVNISHHGAIGDGVFDNYEVIQMCLALAETLRRKIYIPSGTFYVSKTIKSSHMVSYNYRYGVTICGNGKDSILKGWNNKTDVVDYTDINKLSDQSVLALYGSNNIVKNLSIHQGRAAIYMGQDPTKTERSSVCMNIINNVWFDYVGTAILMVNGAGNHYNKFTNLHGIHGQVGVHMMKGFYIKDVPNNNRNMFTNIRFARTWTGVLIEESGGDGNSFINLYGETIKAGQALGPCPNHLLPPAMQNKACVYVDAGGQYNMINLFSAEDCEWHIYNNGYSSKYLNVMSKDESSTTKQVLFDRMPAVYSGNAQISNNLIYQPNENVLFTGIAGVGLQAPYRLFDIGYHRQRITLESLSNQITNVYNLSRSYASRLSREVKWSGHYRFTASFGTTNQYEKQPLKIKLPFPETPENTYTNELATGFTKPFAVFVGSSYGATEIVSARISTAAEASAYGGYHLIINQPATGWRTDAQVNYLAFDISWNI